MNTPTGDRAITAPRPKLEGGVDVIDRYQLVDRLGKGGMAEVFRAKLQSIGGFERDVAVKVLLPSFASEPEFVEMLLDEARIAGAIDHPNVLQVLDVGRKDEIFYLVMEYVDGKDLRSIAKSIPGGRIPLGMALYVVSEMLRGLTAVHTAVDDNGQPRRIVHRDISPGNVMIDRRGFVKLGDFGIAHASGRITRTRVGAVKGKSRYMAPEQLAGAQVDGRSDLYAVGVTLFEAIMGDFARESSRPTIYGPMFTWPERLPDGALPRDVEAILRRAITETPDLRYRDALEFRADLEMSLHRWAPGYNPDTLARELARVTTDAADAAATINDADSTQRAAPVRRPAVQVSRPRWRGVATAQHALPLERGDQTGSRSELTPVQVQLQNPTPEHTSSPTFRSLPGVSPNQGFGMEIQGEPATSLPPDLRVSSLRELARRLDRRVGIALVIAALACVTIGIAWAVAGGGSPPAPIVAPTPVAAPPLQPQSTPLPSTGFVDIRGPLGASVQIGATAYPPAPTRVELPPGDYVLRLRSGLGKKKRVTTHAVHVVAGRSLVLP